MPKPNPSVGDHRPHRIDNSDFRGAEEAMKRAGQVAIERARAVGCEPVVLGPDGEIVGGAPQGERPAGETR
jgi:hypothetical protein